MTKTTATIILLSGLLHCIPANADFIDDAVQNQHRTEENKARDIYRNPAATLKFFGLEQQHHVLEILPGRGWYTEILAAATRPHGKLTVASFGENYPNKGLVAMHHKYVAKLRAKPGTYNHVTVVSFHSGNYAKEVPSGSIDMVLTFRNSHNWLRDGKAELVYQEIARMLRTGGILGLVQHRATDPEQDNATGYVSEEKLIELAASVGLQLVARSEINANPKDSHQHPKGVWTLPPSLRLGDQDKDKYLAIGESDRMTLKFIKTK